MINVRDILYEVDCHQSDTRYSLMQLNDPFDMLLSARVSLFTNVRSHWIAVFEKLVYVVEQDEIVLKLYAVGNCTRSPKTFAADKFRNCYHLYPINYFNYRETVSGGDIQPWAKYWVVNNEELSIAFDERDLCPSYYWAREGAIPAFHVARHLAELHPDVFHASDEVLKELMPRYMSKVLKLDYWHHQDPREHVLTIEGESGPGRVIGRLSDDETATMDTVNALGKFRGKKDSGYFVISDSLSQTFNCLQDETWMQFAQVMSTGDPGFYKPTLEPNTDWLNRLGAGLVMMWAGHDAE